MTKTRKNKKLNSQQIVELIGQAAEAIKALDLKVLDVRKTSNIVDYMIICSGESGPQLRAIEKEIDKILRNNKIKSFRWQGLVKSGWLVLDLGAIVVHIMGVEERAYYNLEELWGKEAVVYHY
ncbi:MAG: ribosome silencing factor [Candidatus Margulisiibacteriota bacterium]